MNRRKFIIRSVLLFLAAGSLYLFWWWRFRLKPGDCRSVIAAILKRRLNYLNLDREGLHDFAGEIHDTLDPYIRERLAQCSLFLPVFGLFDSWAMSGGMRTVYLGLATPLVTRYLLSTGFFPRGGASPDMTIPLKYVPGSALSLQVCGNPWADLSFA